MYGVYKVEGVVVANQWARLEGTDSSAALREGRTTLENVVEYSSTTNSTTVEEGIRYNEPITFNVDTTVDMMGKMVTLYIEKTTILSNSKVLGVSLKDDINHIEATAATKDTLTGYLKGTGIATDKDTQYYVNYGFCKDGAAGASNQVIEYARDVEGWTKVGSTNLNTDIFNLNGVSVEVIDNNNDGVVEYVLYRIETLSQVNRYNDKAETVTIYELDRDKNKKLDGTASTITVDFDELVAEDELAADDVVLYIQYGGRTYIKLADYVTDTMTRVDRDTNKELYVTIGGEQYRQAYNPDAASLVDPDIEHFDINTAREDVGFDTRYDFFLDSTGEYIIAYRPTEKAEANYALVLESAWTLNALKRDGQVKILKTDGTTGTYYIDWDESAKAFAGVTSINRNTCYDRNGDGNITAPSPAPTATPAPNSDALIKDATNSTKLEIYLGTRDVNISGSGTGAGGYNKVNTARGSVIQYSIDENDELTIEAVLQGNTWDSEKDMTIDNTGKEKSTAGVGDNGVIVYLDNNSTNQTSATDPAQKKDPSFQYKLTSTYENGSGTLYVTGADSAELNLDKSGTSANDKVKGKTTNYAIDLDTVGFYYDADEDEYGVAVGWDDMSNVNIDTEAQVYPVLTKKNNGTYEASKLAGVVLFEAPTSAITADYFLVLGANAATSGNWHLTVVFEDGTVDEVTVKKGNLGDFEPKVDEHFYQAWSYSEQADGTYKLGTMYKGHNMSDSKDLLESGGKGIAYNLSNQTFALERECTHGANANLLPYVAYGKDFNIWDVTEVEFKGDTTATGKFSNTRVHAVVIEDKNTLRTAWIWDMEDDDPYVPGTVNKDIIVKIVSDTKIEVELKSGDLVDRADAVFDKLAQEGYTNIKIKEHPTVAGELEVTANKTVNGVERERTFSTTTYETSRSVGGDGVKSVTELDRDNTGKPILTPGTYSASSEQIKDLIDTDPAHASWYPAGDTEVIFTYTRPQGTSGLVVEIIDDATDGVVFRQKMTGLTTPATSNRSIITAINDSSRHFVSLTDSNDVVWGDSTSSTPLTGPQNSNHNDGIPLPDGDYSWTVKSTNGVTTFGSGSFTVAW